MAENLNINPNEDPVYRKKIYKFLTDNFDDFKVSEQDFYKKLDTDQAYAPKVYKVIKDNFSDFDRGEQDFMFLMTPSKKKDQAVSGQPSVVSGSTSPSKSQSKLPSEGKKQQSPPQYGLGNFLSNVKNIATKVIESIPEQKTPQLRTAGPVEQKVKVDKDIELDPNDLVGSFQKRLKPLVKTSVPTSDATYVRPRPEAIFSEQERKRPEVARELDNEKKFKELKNAFLEDPNMSTAQMMRATGLDASQIQNATREQLNQMVRQGNETDRLAAQALADAKDIRQAFSRARNLEEAAILFAALKDPQVARQIEITSSKLPAKNLGEIVTGTKDVMADPKSLFNEVTLGRMIYQLASNPVAVQEIEKNPELKKQFREAVPLLINKYPSFGKSYLGNVISQKMEDMGMNSALLTVVTKDDTDKAVDQLVSEGKMSPTEVQFYKDNMREGGFRNFAKSIVGEQLYKTPGLVERTLESAVAGVKALGSGAGELTGIRQGLVGERDIVATDIAVKDAAVNIRPRTTINEIGAYGGDFLGQILSPGLFGKGLTAAKVFRNPDNAIKALFGLQAFGNYMPQARAMFPGEGLKQRAYSAMLAGLEIATENIFRDRKVIDGLVGKVKPQVAKVIRQFTDKEISGAAARETVEGAIKSAIKSIPQYTKYFAKGVGENTFEETVVSLGEQITDGVFTGKKFNDWVNGQETFETARVSALGSVFIAGLSSRADALKAKGITAKMVYDMAEKPEYWIAKIREGAEVDPDLQADAEDKISNLEYATKVRQDLEKTNLTEKQKIKFLINALDAHVKGKTSQSITDPVLKKRAEQEAKVVEQQQNDILDGIDQGEIEGDRSDEVVEPGEVAPEVPQPTKAGSVGVGGDVEFTSKGGNKAVDKNGEPVIVSHGTKQKYDEIDPSKTIRGAFFTESEERANRYGNSKKYIVKLKNPYETDFDGNLWDEGDGDFSSADDIADYAKENGYDGVIMRNIKGRPEDNFTSTDYVVFDKSQIKAVEQSVKGAAGEVAPEVPAAEKVEQLRAAEQAEYAAMADPKDKAKRKEIYDRYDKLITPLLEKEKEVSAAAPVPSIIEVKSPKEVKQGDTVVWRGEDFTVEEVNAKGGFNLQNNKDRTWTVKDARITDEEFQGKRGEVAAAPAVQKFGVGFAPFREKNVFTEEEDVDIRTSPDYQLHQENVQKVAEGLGIKINNKLDTWGGYVDSETGNPVQEVSNIMEIEATPEQARVMAAILGKAAPEMQDSVLLGNYNEQGAGFEHVISTGSFNNALRAAKYLKDNGLQYFTIDKSTGDIIILDTDNSVRNNIDNFIDQIKENGIEAEHTLQGTNAEFIGREDYDSILSEQGRKIGQQKGFDIDAFVQEAAGKYDAIKAARTEPVVSGETTSDALASELLDILGAPEVVAGEVTPAEVYTKDNLYEIGEEGLSDVQKKVVNDVKNVVNAVANLVEKTTGNELKVTVHKDPNTYGDAVINAGGTKQDSSTKGFYLDADGTIHLNMARVTSETMLHEGFHPVLDFIAKNNPEVIDAFYFQLGKLDGGRAIINDAIEAYRGSDETTIKKEAITDFVAKVADGSFELNQSNFEKVKAFILDLIKKLGFDLTADVKDINDVKELAKFISDKFSSGKEIMSKEFIPVKNDGEPGEVSGAGRLDASEISKAKVPGKNPLKFSKEKFKEVGLVSLPEVSLEEKAKEFNNKAIAINSDPTRVGELTLPSGKKIFMYGGLNYTALEPNVKGEIGFASTTLSKPKQVSGFIKSLFPETDGVGLVLTTSQKPESMLGNAYSLEYTLDAISQLPSKVLRSSEFKREFFGKDIVAVREAFGKKEYNEFVKKYGKADLGSPEVIQAMVEELLTDIGNNFIARNSLVSNMLAGVVEKSTRAATKGEKGFVSVTPNKFIAKVLFDNFGLNQEKLFNEIGEKGIVDAYMNEGKWGFITGGFESDSKVDYMSIQDKGVIHPQFNAKFHGKNAFLLDGAYMIDKLFKPELLEKNKKGEVYIDSKTGLPKPYEKKASLMVAGSMYPKGVIEVAAREFAKPIPQFSRPIELDVVEGFYSPIQKRILEFKQPKASATKWKEIVGAKSDEAVFSGLADWLNSQKPDAQLSKQDVLNFMKDNRIEIKEVTKRDTRTDATKYSQYQLPGGENYKEVLITLPTVSAKKVESLNAELDQLMGIPSDRRTAEQTKRMNSLLDDLSDTNKETFTSSHFDEPNIITHLRMNTRTDVDGNKVLFLEEVQSDWGQKGKREGFEDLNKQNLAAKKQSLINKYQDLDDLKGKDRTLEVAKKKTEILDEIKSVNKELGLEEDDYRTVPVVGVGISKAPFVTNTNAWVKLGLKYALKEAVRQGADRIAWTTGSQQNERYSLSKSVDSIQYAKTGDDSFLVSVTGKNGEEVLYNTGMSLKDVEATLGKDIADKINSGFGEEEKAKQRSVSDLKSLPTIKGEGLEVGGKGMKAFYGDAQNPGIVANVAKALVKELTGKEGGLVESGIKVTEKVPEGTSVADIWEAGGMDEFKKKLEKTSSQPAIEITPELRQSVQGGMPQFSRDNQLLKIKDFVQAQKNKGVSDDVIREALDKVADKVGLNKQEIDNLMAGEFPTKPKEYAVQEQAAGKVPVQPKARVSEEVEGGVPPTRPEEITEEGEVEGEEGEVKIKPSGIKKGLVSQEVLAKMNLEKVGDKELLESGRKIIDSGEVNPPSLVNKILDEGKGVLTPAEVVALITYKADLDNKQEALAKEIAKREESGKDLGTLLADMKTLQTEIDNFDMAAVITAQQQSMSFRLRRYMLDRSYNITVQIEKYKRANNGVIPAEIEKKFREMDAKIKELNKKLTEAEAQKYEQEGKAAMENIVEDVQREQKNGPALYTEAELEEKIQKGVQAEIEKIYTAMPTPKRSAAQRAITALENIQKKLRSKTYDASLGIPVAVIDAGITAIKNAIKLGIEVEKAVEIGIKTIKDKLKGKQWAKENDFRKDMIDGFKAEGVSLKAKKTEPKINDDGTVTIPNQLIRDLVAKGITDIDDLADAVRKIVEPQLPGVTNRQIRDYITGYGKQVNPTRDDITTKMNTAKRVGRLLSQLEDLQKMGAAAYMLKYRTQKPSGNKLTQKEQELRKLIKQLEKDAIGEDEALGKIQEQKDLDTAKARIRRRIDELSGKIARKDFSPKAKKQVPADQELRDLQSEKEKVKEQFDNAQYEAEQKNKSLGRKINDALNELLVGLARTLVTGFDFGVVFTQGVKKVFTNPIMSAKAFAEGMKQFASESRQKKFENDLRASGAYELIKNSGLAVSVGDERASVQEQIFIANYVNLLWNGLATIVTFNHKPSKEFVKALNPFKASQRFMDAYLNYIRINTFLDISSSISKDGYPPEVDPELHKSAAEWVNTTTMKGAKNIPRSLGFLMFSASKVAAELKLFSPYVFVYYYQMPGPIRKRALLNFGKFALSFLAVTSLMRAALGDDDDDEFWDITSSNFLTFKFGDQRVSFAGGMRPMLVFWGRFFSGRYVDQYGEVSKLGERPGKDVNTKGDLVVRFFTSKFAPVPSAVWSKLEERAGREVEDDVLINKLIIPMWLQDSKELYENNPREIGALYTMLSLIGANVRTIETPFKKEQKVGNKITYSYTVGSEDNTVTRKHKVELNDEQQKKYQELFDEIYAKNIKNITESDIYKNKKAEEKLLFEVAFSKKAKADAESDAQKLLVRIYSGEFKKFPLIVETPEEKALDRILNRGEKKP